MKPALRRLLSFLVLPRHLAAFVITVCSAAAVVVATTRLYDPDIWWVAAAGREALAQQRVPEQNLFSFTEPGHEWLMHEWLLGPPYALGLQRFGPAFYTAVTLIVLTVGLGLILRGTVGRARNPGAGLALAFVAVTCFGARLLSARPTGVAQLFPLALCLLAFAPRFSALSALSATAIELVWTNTHGSFPLGIALVSLAALDSRHDRPLRIATAAALVAVTLVNPYGLALHRFVAHYALGDTGIYREIHGHVEEFGSLFDARQLRSGLGDLLPLALIALASAAALRVAKYRARAAFCLLLIVAAAMQVRHVALVGLLVCLLLLPWLDEQWETWGLAGGAARSSGAALRPWALLVLPCALGVGLFAAVSLRRSAGDSIAEGPAFLRALSAVRPGSRLYAPFSEAGIAIWYGFPRRIRVFFDSRNDCYSAETARAFWRLGDSATPSMAAREILVRTGTDAALIPSDHALAFLKDDANWSERYREAGWLLYERVQPARP